VPLPVINPKGQEVAIPYKIIDSFYITWYRLIIFSHIFNKKNGGILLKAFFSNPENFGVLIPILVIGTLCYVLINWDKTINHLKKYWAPIETPEGDKNGKGT